jgi:hypothetical protein
MESTQLNTLAMTYTLHFAICNIDKKVTIDLKCNMEICLLKLPQGLS